MRTHSHFLISAFVWDVMNRRHPPINTGRAFLIGSVVPDIPLMLLTLWYIIHRYNSENPPSEENPIYGPEYDAYYFHNDWWKLLLSLFHAPFLIVLYLSMGAAAWSLSSSWGTPIMWFSTSCGLHAFLDLFTQVEDGLLVLFPFNWHYRSAHRFQSKCSGCCVSRFQSWVSFYDPAHGGRMFTLFEFILDSILILYFLYRGLESSLSQKRKESYTEVESFAEVDVYTNDGAIV